MFLSVFVWSWKDLAGKGHHVYLDNCYNFYTSCGTRREHECGTREHGCGAMGEYGCGTKHMVVVQWGEHGCGTRRKHGSSAMVWNKEGTWL
jgi:hypothetical protein